MASQVTSTAESFGNKALSTIPVVGPILSSIAGAVEGIFGSSHAAAVTKEAQVLNSNFPLFLSNVESIMAGVSSGQITEAQGISNLQQALASYTSSVSSIIKKGGSCQSTEWVNAHQSGNAGCCNISGTCNAACCLLCCVASPAVGNLIAAIQAGKGTVRIPSTPNNGAIQGTPAITITYSAPSALKRIENLIFGELAKI
jgi:hypothetical protein